MGFYYSYRLAVYAEYFKDTVFQSLVNRFSQRTDMKIGPSDLNTVRIVAVLLLFHCK